MGRRGLVHFLPVGLTLGIVLLLVLARVGPVAAQQSEADVFVAQASLAYDDKHYAEALSLLQEALKIDPDNVDALYYTGLIHLAQRQADLAVASLERALTLAPTDQPIRFQLGVAYFTLEQYDKAEPLLVQVFAEHPRLDGLGYYVGFMRYRQKNYQGALRAFTAGTSSDPGIQQLTRFYAGLVLAILGLPERAAAEVEEALRAQPASPLTAPAERIRDTILSARERERRFRAEVRLGFLYDDNVVVNPNEKSDDANVVDLRRRKTRGTGEVGALRLEYVWLRTGPWEATASYSFMQSLNNNLPSYNIRNHLGALAGFYRGTVEAMPFQLGAQYAYDYLTLKDSLFLQRHTATLFGSLVEDGANLTTAQTRLQVKQFAHGDNSTPEELRDASNMMVGLTHTLRFAADKHLLRLGYQLDVEEGDGRNFEYLGHRILAGAQYTLPWGDARLKYDYEVHFRSYRHIHTLLPTGTANTVKRGDTEQTHVVRVEQPLPHNLTLSLEYQGIISRSNLAVYSSDRNVVSLILSWQY